MATSVVIDKDILGWADENIERLKWQYSGILQVGKHPELPQRSFDENIAYYCEQHDCDLITGDARAYTHFFKIGIVSVQISQKDWWKKADKPIYLVQIQNRSSI